MYANNVIEFPAFRLLHKQFRCMLQAIDALYITRSNGDYART